MSQRIHLDATPGLFHQVLHCHQGDVGRQFEIAVVTRDGYEIPSGATFKIQATKPSGLGFTVTGTAANNIISFTSTEDMTSEAGEIPTQLEIKSGNDVIYTSNFLLVCETNVHPSSVTDGSPEEIISEITLLVERAESAASTAGADAAAAAQARVDEMMNYLPTEVTNLKSDINAHDIVLFETNSIDAGTVLTATTNAFVNNGDGTYNITTGDFGTIIFGAKTLLPKGVYLLYGASKGWTFLSTDTTLGGNFVLNRGATPKILVLSADTECYLGYRIDAEPTESFVIEPFLKRAITIDIDKRFSVIDYIDMKPINLIDSDSVVSGYLDGNGYIEPHESYSTTDFISVADYNSLIFSNCNFFGWYDANKEFITPIQAINTLDYDRVITIPSNAKYLRITIQNDRLNVAQVGVNVSRGNYVPHSKYTLPNLVRDEGIEIEHFNIFNKEMIESGYLAGDGEIILNSDYITSSFIDVSAYTELVLSKTNFIAWYNADKAFISLDATNGNSLSVDKKVTVPTNAVYLRLTGVPVELNNIQVGRSVSRDNYMGYDAYQLNNLRINEVNIDPKTIVVDVNGDGDYTSFTQALYENDGNKIDMVVKSGIYDIKAEYVSLFGQSVVDNLSDSTSGIKDFQYGVRIHDRKITFESGSHLVCDWTGHTVDETHRFCALVIEPNAELIGLDLDCTATFYCIHDDYGTADDSPFTIKYENCRVIGHNLYNANCIGGGAHKYSRHILNNCYFKNNVSSSDRVLSADVRYHNTNTPNAEPELYVSNCYFSNNMNVTYYGNQTTKFKAYVNNCFAPYGIIKRAESSSMSVDNVELYTWNNQTN